MWALPLLVAGGAGVMDAMAASRAKTTESGPSKGQKMNVLFIIVDDMKPVSGCYGDRTAITPNIDALAARGTLFRHNYCQQALSGPTRVSILTGLRPDNSQIWTMPRPMREVYPGIVSMPQYLRSLGYQTVGMGKIFDPRNVDQDKDSPSWSTPFMSEWSYYNPTAGKPTGGYMLPETKKLYAQATREAAGKGLKDRDARVYVNAHAGPSTECADVPDDAYMDGALARLGAATIKKLAAEADRGKPFFLAVGFRKPHLPFVAPKRYWDLYTRENMPLAEFVSKPQNSVEEAYSSYNEIVSFYDIPPLYTFCDHHQNNGIISEDKQRELLHGYYACISYIDTQIGMVLEALRESGADKNTVVVLAGDHGWHLGDHGLWAKHTNFEQAARAALIISDPRIKPSVTDQVTEFIDIFPTVCTMAGVPRAPHLDGVDLTPLMKEPTRAVNEVAVSQFNRDNNVMGYSIRDTRYRYTVWFGNNYRTTLPYDDKLVISTELYDYDKDPLETVNQAGSREYAAVRRQMHEKLLHLIAAENRTALYHKTQRRVRTNL